MNESISSNQKEVSQDKLLELITSAEVAFNKAYAPYSEFRVGAAALTNKNMVVLGCNVENASYGLTVCAERNCIAQGVINNTGSDDVKFSAIAIYTNQEKLTPPCGACRQVIAEFFPADAIVIAVNHLKNKQSWTVSQLLPDAFTPQDLLNKN